MTSEHLDIHETPDGLMFKVHVQPRASRNRILGVFGDALKIAVTAPPVDDAANRMVLQLLAEALGIPAGALCILSGHTSRSKRIRWRIGGSPSEEGTAAKKLLLSIVHSGHGPVKVL
uniref:UPF0235 protein ENS29_16495 n=1 Tax=Desulfatirhabdium butyrativorans TaxID=340467 RepID=A0A7C4RUF3_9BACT